MFWIILIGLVVIVFVFVAKNEKETKESNKKLASSGYNFNQKVDSGKYISGHPDIDDPITSSIIVPKSSSLVIINDIASHSSRVQAEIANNFIKNVLVEDQTTIERRVTVGRLLLTGLFAFALKKKKKNELAYLVIEWNDGKFEHETIFEFEGKEAIQNANTARNKLIRLVR